MAIFKGKNISVEIYGESHAEKIGAKVLGLKPFTFCNDELLCLICSIRRLFAVMASPSSSASAELLISEICSSISRTPSSWIKRMMYFLRLSYSSSIFAAPSWIDSVLVVSSGIASDIVLEKRSSCLSVKNAPNTARIRQ